jgi:regulator of sigma E protease
LVREGGKMLDQLAGPVGAVRFLGEAGAAGAEIFIYTASALSIMIGVFNLLPLPALDGGRLLFLAVEAVRRRPVDPRREGYIHLVGFALLILLLVTLTVRDIGKL